MDEGYFTVAKERIVSAQETVNNVTNVKGESNEQ